MMFYSKLTNKPVEVLMKTEPEIYIGIDNNECYSDFFFLIKDSNNNNISEQQLDEHLKAIDLDGLIYRLKDPNFLKYGNRWLYISALKEQNLTEIQKRLVKMYETKR
jgi:hypothetical protein